MKKGIALFMVLVTLCLAAGCGEEAVNKSGNTSTTAASPAATEDGTNASGDYDEYPYDIAEDKKKFDYNNIDIVVGDKLYMTQINDWFENFSDYEGKSVEIEGYYMYFDGSKYTFVGRNGPSCQYCTGGYVNFEFQTDEDLSDYVTEKTWITVTGILRQGTIHSSEGTKPFYYIEAMKIEKHLLPGKDTIVD